MGTLFTIIVRFAIRLLGTLGVVVLVLLAGHWLTGEWSSWDTATGALERLSQVSKKIAAQNTLMRDALVAEVPNPGAPIGVVAKQRHRFENEVRSLDERIGRIESDQPFEVRVPGSPAWSERARAKCARVLYQQAWEYTDQLHKALISTQSCKQQLLTAKAEMLGVAADIYGKIEELEQLEKSAGLQLLNPYSDQRQRRDKLAAELNSLTDRQTKATAQYNNVARRCTARDPMNRFAVDLGPLAPVLQPLDDEIAELQRKVNTSAVRKFAQLVLDILPVALGIVAGIFAAPIAIKLFAFHIVAPWVGRCRPIRLDPSTSGLVESREPGDGKRDVAPRSVVSLPLLLRPDEELVVHAEYVQSSAEATRKDTLWLLDWTMPLTSLAAGLYGLMRLSGNEAEPVVLSSSSDPLNELTALVLPRGSAMVLQPRCLVALVRQQGDRIRITRHWQLGHLSSWLTLQLRYIVFHGPLTLVLRGCRGVRIEPVSAGRVINQAATLGFSANVDYSNGRCETFGAYLLGQQELFNDRFTGTTGVYIYEETPRPGMRGGIMGRGIEGVLDTLLKVMGI